MTTSLANTDVRMALDARGLDQLKRQSRANPDEALKAAAKQFEAVFVNTLLKSMRDALPNSDLLASNESKTYRGLLDQEMASRLADRGIGIADMMVRQLSADKRQVKPSLSGASAELEKMDAPPERARTPSAASRRFVEVMRPEAKVAERETGIPAEFIVGQAALESGWGRKEIRRPDGSPTFNLFGIKAGSGWKGATVDVTTTEYVGGVARKVVDKFRAYSSYAESFQDYAKLIAGSPRYSEAVKQADSAAGFAKGLQQGGYATDPRYAEKLTSVINQTIALTRTRSDAA
jgi:peptidoglycan hydrolase FlgJ